MIMNQTIDDVLPFIGGAPSGAATYAAQGAYTVLIAAVVWAIARRPIAPPPPVAPPPVAPLPIAPPPDTPLPVAPPPVAPMSPMSPFTALMRKLGRSERTVRAVLAESRAFAAIERRHAKDRKVWG